jgi:hypothetical protein
MTGRVLSYYELLEEAGRGDFNLAACLGKVRRRDLCFSLLEAVKWTPVCLADGSG